MRLGEATQPGFRVYIPVSDTNRHVQCRNIVVDSGGTEHRGTADTLTDLYLDGR